MSWTAVPRQIQLAVVASMALVAGCGSDDGPVGGTLNLNVATPHPDDGGMLLTLIGGPVDSVESPGNQVYTFQLDANTLRVIIAGNLGSAPVARLHVPDVRRAARYSAVVTQVAARTSYLQRNPAQYAVTVDP